MRRTWTREEIEVRVDELHSEHTGRAFAKAVKQFSKEELGPEARPLLRELLLERAAAVNRNIELDRRFREGGWFRRTMKRLDDALDSRSRRSDER
jgi:ribosomal protein L29